MKRALTFLILAFSLSAEDIYVSQNAAGGDTGVDASNAHSAAWFNDAGNWGAGADKVSAGDTVHLTGTVTNGISFRASGTSGNPITLLFESGANITVPTFAGNYGIDFQTYNYICLDGGANGIIQCTANGTGLAHSDNTVVIHSAPSVGGVIIQNLTITNIFVRTPDSSDTSYDGANIQFYSSPILSNCVVRNCRLSYNRYGIMANFSGASTNFQCYSNTIIETCVGISIGDNPGSSLTGAHIYDNTFNKWDAWDQPADFYHHVAVHGFAFNGGTFQNVFVYGNTIGPDYSQSQYNTAGIFFEYVNNVYIYNNVVWSDTTQGWNSGYLYDKGGNGGLIANNTIYMSSGGFVGMTFTLGATNIFVCNNIIANSTGASISVDGTSSIQTNANLATSSPLFVDAGSGDFHLQSGSPAVGYGTNLSAYFTTDFNGKLRPSTGPWDIGAYQYVSGSTNAPGTDAVLRYELNGISGGGFSL